MHLTYFMLETALTHLLKDKKDKLQEVHKGYRVVLDLKTVCLKVRDLFDIYPKTENDVRKVLRTWSGLSNSSSLADKVKNRVFPELSNTLSIQTKVLTSNKQDITKTTLGVEIALVENSRYLSKEIYGKVIDLDNEEPEFCFKTDEENEAMAEKIFETLCFDIDFDCRPYSPSNDYYTPDDPGGVDTLEAHAKVDYASLKKVLPKLTKLDFVNLHYALSNIFIYHYMVSDVIGRGTVGYYADKFCMNTDELEELLNDSNDFGLEFKISEDENYLIAEGDLKWRLLAKSKV